MDRAKEYGLPGIQPFAAGELLKLYSLTDFVDKSGARIREKLRPADVPVMEADISKVQRLTGWKPEISLEQTIGDMLRYWLQVVKDGRA